MIFFLKTSPQIIFLLLLKGKRKENGKDKKKRQTGLLFSPQPSAKKKSSFSPASQYAVDELHKLQFKFINNEGHPDKVTIDPNFHSMIDSDITHAKELK